MMIIYFSSTTVSAVNHHCVDTFPRSDNPTILFYLDASYEPATVTAPVTLYGLS